MAFNEDNGMVMPVTPYGGFGNNDSGSWWILLLFILLGGWGNGFGGYGGAGAGFVDNSVQRGFDQSAIINGLTGINSTLTAGFANAETAASARQMADMQQMFALQSQFSQCCCDNKAAIADLKYTIASEACADRAAVTSAMQTILDTMCQDKIDSKNEKIVELQNAINMANLAASQVAQTAEIISKLPASTTA